MSRVCTSVKSTGKSIKINVRLCCISSDLMFSANFLQSIKLLKFSVDCQLPTEKSQRRTIGTFGQWNLDCVRVVPDQTGFTCVVDSEFLLPHEPETLIFIDILFKKYNKFPAPCCLHSHELNGFPVELNDLIKDFHGCTKILAY